MNQILHRTKAFNRVFDRGSYYTLYDYSSSFSFIRTRDTVENSLGGVRAACWKALEKIKQANNCCQRNNMKKNAKMPTSM
jgi:hypothetical protein